VADLGEKIKDPRQHVDGYADPIIGNGYRNFVSGTLRRKDDPAALGRVFSSVVQKVADDLRQSREVSVEPDF
jgi:hypothetical protein